jgi:serine/threonine protein kinase/tetratricopeptide (TPR) repeat protein
LSFAQVIDALPAGVFENQVVFTHCLSGEWVVSSMIGETVSHYRILGKLGRGGMGVVYLAEDTHLARRVAIKFSDAPKENEAYRARFLREARAASALSHPHIARIYDYGESADGQPFLVMELVNGEDLAHLLQRGRMSVLQAVRIAEEVAEALAEAHRGGIIHRDIKPSNIVINERGQVKVLDFGLAKLYQEPAAASEGNSTVATSATAEGTVLGTPAYMSPEQARESPLAPRSDLFALGSVLYECLAGRRAFAGANSVEILAGVLHLDPPPPSHFNSRVPPALDAVVAKAMAKNPEGRYQSAHEMLADLQAARSSMTQSETEETEVLPAPAVSSPARAGTLWHTLETLTSPLRRSRTTTAVTLFVLLAAIGAAWWELSDRTYQAAPEALRWYQEGVAALRDGTYYKASKALEQAVTRDPQFNMAHARLAEAYQELDLTDKAREEMLRAAPPGASPVLRRAERLYLRALQLTLTGDFAGAAAIYRDLLSRAPAGEKANAWLDLGRAYEKNEKVQEATEAYRQATRRQSQNPAAWLRLAILDGRQLQKERASQAFDQAEQLYRGLSNLEGAVEVLYQRAVMANRMANFAEAQTLLGEALKLSTDIGSVSQQIQALLQLSAAEYRGAGDYPQAQADAAKAIDMARANGLENLTARGLVELGNAYFLKGDADEARKAYTQSLEYARRFHSERNEARALFSLGSLAMRYGNVDEAIGDVQQSLMWYQRGGYQKETANALVLLARAQRQKGDYAAAFQSFEQQLRIGKQMDDPSLVALAEQGRGSVLLAQGRLPESLAAYRQAYEAAHKTGDQLNASYDLLDSAELCWRLGRYPEARQALGDAGPNPSRAVAALDDQTRADMALSQRDFRGAMEFSRHVLEQQNLGADLTVAANSSLGAAQIATGARADGLKALAEAERVAEKSGSAQLIADARLAYAEGLLAAGDARRARDTALAAQQWFASVGNAEGEWRTWLVASGVEKSFGDGEKSRDFARRATQLLATLQQKWDADSYKTYLARPDIQDRGKQLATLAAAR